jgi:Tol biopolymer transport system component
MTAALLLPPAVVGADAFSPSFTEYGRQLLFHTGRRRSALMRASFDDRGRPALVTVLQDGASNFHVSESRDGRWIAYDSDRDGTRGVYVAPSNDPLAARRVSGEGYAAIPKWSLDGRKLAFVKGEARRPRVWNVWVADLAANTLTRVSRHSVGQAWGGSWFPDDRIAYSVEDRLVIADLPRGTTRVVRSPRSGHLIRTPAVSPDGRWVVFQVHRDGAWLLNVATGRMRRVLDDATAEEFAWSPDGRRVVYHARRNGAWSLWQLALDPAA